MSSPGVAICRRRRSPTSSATSYAGSPVPPHAVCRPRPRGGPQKRHGVGEAAQQALRPRERAQALQQVPRRARVRRGARLRRGVGERASPDRIRPDAVADRHCICSCQKNFQGKNRDTRKCAAASIAPDDGRRGARDDRRHQRRAPDQRLRARHRRRVPHLRRQPDLLARPFPRGARPHHPRVDRARAVRVSRKALQPAVREPVAAPLSEAASACLDPLAGQQGDDRLGFAPRPALHLPADVQPGEGSGPLSEAVPRHCQGLRLRGKRQPIRLVAPCICFFFRPKSKRGGESPFRGVPQRVRAHAARDAAAAGLYLARIAEERDEGESANVRRRHARAGARARAVRLRQPGDSAQGPGKSLERHAFRKVAGVLPVRHPARRPHTQEHGAVRSRGHAGVEEAGSIEMLRFFWGLIAAAAAFSASPQSYPAKPVRIIVPSAPGGGYDFIGRLAAERFSQEFGQGFVVENRVGAGTLVGTLAAATAPADGYTLLVGGLANMAFNPGLHKDLRYDPVTDFTPIAMVGAFTYALVGRKDLAPSTLRELIDFARANPGKLTIATSGIGTGQHVSAVLLKRLANIDALLPNVPTGREAGLEDLVLDSWLGLFAQSKTPRAIIRTLRGATLKMLEAPDTRKRLEANGWRIISMSSAETEAFVRSEAEKWPRFLQQAEIKAE